MCADVRAMCGAPFKGTWKTPQKGLDFRGGFWDARGCAGDARGMRGGCAGDVRGCAGDVWGRHLENPPKKGLILGVDFGMCGGCAGDVRGCAGDVWGPSTYT